MVKQDNNGNTEALSKKQRKKNKNKFKQQQREQEHREQQSQQMQSKSQPKPQIKPNTSNKQWGLPMIYLYLMFASKLYQLSINYWIY